MSVPHLDTRIIGGRRSLLFGPYAGFSTKFLKSGSYLDLPRSLTARNVGPIVAAGLQNLGLTGYLIGQVLQSPAARMAALRELMPSARAEDWELAAAGQRVQVIKPHPRKFGTLEFGTEVVAAADGSLAALLGASPGASTAVNVMVGVLARFLGGAAGPADVTARLRALVPTLGLSSDRDGAGWARVRARNDEILGLGG
jgi:malate dehydrogenase (quinone)